ncbi:MAG: hypothetical protein KAI74_01950 [Kiritimatiellae bacterium]|nr:hypothetical protein [Kiritimatiellia bacterium]
MDPKSKSVFQIGGLFIAGGFVSIVGGALAMIAFFKQPDVGDDLTVLHMLRGVILPHVFIFLGVGVLVYGTIIIAQVVIVNRRKNHLPQ